MNSTDLLRLGFSDIARHLQNREVSSVEVTTALLDRIDAVQGELRAYTHIYRRRAKAAAEAADRRRARNEALSPYDGAPLSLKECIATAGDEMTLGLPTKKGDIAAQDAVMAKLIKDQGGVILGKTNVSQAMLFHESRNPLFGETKNPHHHGRTPGGSSGGEAAAIAAHMSPGGFGTDIGGSVRVPAHFCGIVGLKPTANRLSKQGFGAGVPGQETIASVVGPMARTVDDAAALFELVSPEKCAPYDPRVVPYPLGDWRAIDLQGKRIGVITTDHIVTPSAACQRAVRTAAQHLEDAGCIVEEFEPPMAEDIIFTYFAALSADGGKTLIGRLGSGEVDDALTLLLRSSRLAKPTRKAAALALGVVGERVAGRIVESLGEKSVAELWAITARARKLTEDVFALWRHRGFDAVITPPHATVALPHRTSRDFAIGGAFSMRYNLLNFPGGVVPVTTVRDDETTRHDVSQRHDKRAAQVDAGSAGLPVGVQIVTKPFREDLNFALMKAIEQRAIMGDDYPRGVL